MDGHDMHIGEGLNRRGHVLGRRVAAQVNEI